MSEMAEKWRVLSSNPDASSTWEVFWESGHLQSTGEMPLSRLPNPEMPCDELENCSGVDPALAHMQLGEAPISPPWPRKGSSSQANKREKSRILCRVGAIICGGECNKLMKVIVISFFCSMADKRWLSRMSQLHNDRKTGRLSVLWIRDGAVAFVFIQHFKMGLYMSHICVFALWYVCGRWATERSTGLERTSCGSVVLLQSKQIVCSCWLLSDEIQRRQSPKTFPVFSLSFDLVLFIKEQSRQW